MMRLIPSSSLLLLALTSGCQTFEGADLTRYSVRDGIPVSSHRPPETSRLIGVIHAQEDGFYLLGLIPIAPVNLQNCLDRLVVEAKAQGADGIADIQCVVNPAHMFLFSALGFPDWSAHVRVSGTTYRLAEPAPPQPRPRSTERPPIRTAPMPTPAKK